MEIMPTPDKSGSQVKLDGRLDNRRCDELRNIIEQLDSLNAGVIELNCAHLRSVTASGIVLINALSSRFSQLQLTQVPKPVAELLKLCGVNVR